jgi:hypothetical protein
MRPDPGGNISIKSSHFYSERKSLFTAAVDSRLIYLPADILLIIDNPTRSSLFDTYLIDAEYDNCIQIINFMNSFHNNPSDTVLLRKNARIRRLAVNSIHFLNFVGINRIIKAPFRL